jgi:hypothetical protein
MLMPWLKLFSRENFLILRSEDFYADTQRAVTTITDFLRLPPHRITDLVAHNQGGEHAAMDSKTRSRLETVFDEPNRELKNLLGIEWP